MCFLAYKLFLPGKMLNTIRKKFRNLRRNVKHVPNLFNKNNYKLFGLGVTTLLSSLLPMKAMADTYFSFHTQPKTFSLTAEKKVKDLSFLLNISPIVSQTKGPNGNLYLKGKNTEISLGLGFNSGKTTATSFESGFESGYYEQNNTIQTKQNDHNDRAAFSYTPEWDYLEKIGNLKISYLFENKKDENLTNTNTRYIRTSSDTTNQAGYNIMDYDTTEINSNAIIQTDVNNFTSSLQIDSKKFIGRPIVDLLRYGVFVNWFYSNTTNSSNVFTSVNQRGNVIINSNNYPYESTSSSTGHNENENERHVVTINPYLGALKISNINEYPFGVSLGLEGHIGIGEGSALILSGFIGGESSLGVEYNLEGKVKTGDNDYQKIKIELFNRKDSEKESSEASILGVSQYENKKDIDRDIVLSDPLKEYKKKELEKMFNDRLSGISYGLNFEKSKSITGSLFLNKYDSYGLSTIGLEAGILYDEGAIKPVVGFKIGKNNWYATASAKNGYYNFTVDYTSSKN